MATQLASAPKTRKRPLEILLQFQGYFGLIIVLIIGIIFSPVRNGTNLFIDVNNQMNILRYVAETGIIAIGMTLVILVGEIDLSVGAVLAFVATLTALLLTTGGLGTFPTFIVSILAGIAFGVLNGVTTTGLRIPSFVVTLAMMSFARGLSRMLSGGVAVPLLAVSQGGEAPESAFFITQRIGGVFPVPALFMFVIAILVVLLMRFTSFGRHVYAIGGNQVAARLSGVRVNLTKIIVFAICSALTALAAFVHAIQLNQGAPNDGNAYELNAIAAVVIGGTSLMGGVGSIAGSVAGALMLGMIDNILTLNRIPADVQLLIKGALIVAAVALQRLQRRV
jgi:ribose transport system permease protein